MAGLTTASTDPVAPQAADATPPAAEDAEERPTLRRRTAVGAFYVALAAAVLPVLVAAVRAAIRGWAPNSDAGYTAIRAWDVFSAHPPLIGTGASPSAQVHRQINHPGALNYDLFAVPMRVFGLGAGLALGVALVNVLAIVGIAWLVRRRVDIGSATVAMAAVAVLVWSLGSEVLYDPWHTHAPLLPFALFLFAVWSVVAGDLPALVPLVLAGSYASQYHLSFVVPVAALGAFAAAVAVVRLWRQRGGDSWPAARASALRWGAVALVVGLLCWAQPLVDQAVGPGEGNLLALARASRVQLPQPSAAGVVRAYGGTVALPPFWLPPSFAHPSFAPDGTGRPLALAAAGLAGLLVVLVVLGWRAGRRGRPDLAAGAATAAVTLVVGVATLLRTPVASGLVTFYLRWMWPLGMFVWLLVVLLVIDGIQAWRRGGTNDPRPTGRLALGAALVAVVAGACALPTADNGSGVPGWTVEAVNHLRPEVLDAVDGQGAVLVELPIAWPVVLAGPGLVAALDEHGVPFVVQDPIIVNQVGHHRSYEPGEADLRLRIVPGSAEPQPGERLVASWSGLSEDETAELDRLDDELTGRLRGGGVEVDPSTGAVLDALDLEDWTTTLAVAGEDPERLLASDVLWGLVRGRAAQYAGHSLVQDPRGPSDLLDRWAELAERRDLQTLAVYLGPVG